MVRILVNENPKFLFGKSLIVSSISCHEIHSLIDPLNVFSCEFNVLIMERPFNGNPESCFSHLSSVAFHDLSEIHTGCMVWYTKHHFGWTSKIEWVSEVFIELPKSGFVMACISIHRKRILPNPITLFVINTVVSCIGPMIHTIINLWPLKNSWFLSISKIKEVIRILFVHITTLYFNISFSILFKLNSICFKLSCELSWMLNVTGRSYLNSRYSSKQGTCSKFHCIFIYLL